MKKTLSIPSSVKGFSLLLLGIIGLACQKVINVDLNSADPRIVIEGSISDQSGPYFVTLSQTVNFDEANVFPSIRDANIVISDNLGNSESLIETSPGTYRTSSMQGVPGRIYTLTVTADGKEYVATSTMPPSVNIDSLTVENLFIVGNKLKVIDVHFQDPANVKNYYRFVEVKNAVVQKFIFLYDDRVQDGRSMSSALFADEDTLRTGDSVLVLLQCVDKGVFDYFRTMGQASGAEGPQTASPANPVSNISNGALGYFNAYAVRSKRIIIP
ncbi:MAG: DUF4249 domain-containing protein [Bacteroidota bacterium]|jgi:hypothetical protein